MYAKKINKLKKWIIFSLDVMWAFKEQLLFITQIKKIHLTPYMLLWVNPKDIWMTKCKADPDCIVKLKRKFILDGSWDKELVNPLEHMAVKSAYEVSKGNSTWKISGDYSRVSKLIKKNGKFDNCFSIEDLNNRYEELDKIITHTKKVQKYVPQKNLNKIHFREHGGMEVAIGSNGEIIKVGDGQHRLGIVLGLGLSEIPVSLTLVHSDFLNTLNFKNFNIKN